MGPTPREILMDLTGRYEENSVLDSLYELWIDRDPACNDDVRRLYKELGDYTAELSIEGSDRITAVLADLCVIYSRCAYLDGLKTGGRLILELLADT